MGWFVDSVLPIVDDVDGGDMDWLVCFLQLGRWFWDGL